MYFPYFVAYMAIGFAVAVPVFYWAVKTHQFRDQARARFLPLEGENLAAPVRVSRLNRYEAYALLTLALLGLGSSAAVLVMALMKAGA